MRLSNHKSSAPRAEVFWYADRAQEYLPSLERDISADIVVVGGGMAGLTTAHELCMRGLSVVLLEREFCGAGASGKSSGFITPDSELELSQLIRRFGIDRAKKLWEFAASGVLMIQSNIEKLGIHCDYHAQDSLFVANKPNGVEDVAAEYSARSSIGYASTKYSRDELAQVLGSGTYYGGVRYPDTFGMNSYQYCQGMKKALIEKGVRLYERTNVVGVTAGGVSVARGAVRARHVILCADRFTPELGVLKRRVYHAQTFLMASRPLSEQEIGHIFPSAPLMVWDTDLVYQYFRIIGGGRLLFGGAHALYTYAGREATRTGFMYRQLRRFFSKKFPGLDLSWDYIWPGMLGISKDLLPIVGIDEGMIYYVCAESGLPWSAAGGRYIAEKIVHGRDDYDEFFAPTRRFAIPDDLHPFITTKAAFALSNLWSKYYQRD